MAVYYARYSPHIMDNGDSTHSREITTESVIGVTKIVKYPAADGIDLVSIDNFEGSKADSWDVFGSDTSSTLSEMGLPWGGSSFSSSERGDSSSRSLSDR